MSKSELVIKLPRRIDGLAELAYNLWWSWHLEARELFKVLDRNLWTVTVHNPVQMLQRIPQSALVAASQNPEFLRRYDYVMDRFKDDMSAEHSWFMEKYPGMSGHKVAYFSLEFAIHNSLPIYAGGLGILAGDYYKEASDIGVPMIAIGFMYPQGYFHQNVDKDGWQEEIYTQLNFNEAPITQLIKSDGKPLIVEVPLDDHSIYVAVWYVNIGKLKLYLLDTDIDQNSPDDRKLSARLYVGDREIRLKQEIVIGIGGVRVLRALGISPCVWHANEGHTGFMMLERIRELVNAGMDLGEAVKQVRACTIFTTHTPVPAGNDTFPLNLVEKYLEHFWLDLNIDRESFLALGTQATDGSAFNMTVLCLNLSSTRNGVSQLHGETCRRIWHSLWPELSENEVPITYVTNGIHVPTWVSPQANRLYAKYLGVDWLKRHDDPALWQKIDNLPDKELWEMRRWLKYKLVRAIEDRIRQRWSATGLDTTQTLAMGSLVDSEFLTLGFCRRSTEYKRATLIFHDIERIKKILKDEQRPVQIVFAGKAHPDDMVGKYLIQEIYKLGKDPDFMGRIAFVENYDMHMARFLVQGVDVWISNPRWLEEACGTSGMKSCLNGGLQLSVLDGWWCEGYNGSNGWAIENLCASCDAQSQNSADSEQIYRLLEEKIVPLFYDRDLDGIPHGWIAKIKGSISSIAPFFNTKRMIKEYAESMYIEKFNTCKSTHEEHKFDHASLNYNI